MGYQTVLFDLDGTLLYTIRDLADAVNHALSSHGHPTHPADRIERMVGNGVGNLIARALPGGRGESAPDYGAVLADFRTYYDAHCLDHTRPYDGVTELLAALKAAGVKTAIVTNKYQEAAEELLRRFFDGLIDAVAGDMPGRRRKPEPDAVNAALAALGADREGAVYVGDTEIDMATAENAGLPCVCVAWGYRTEAELRAQRAPAVARDAAELLELLTENGRRNGREDEA